MSNQMSNGTSVSISVVLLAITAFLHWRAWGVGGKTNLGPRIAALTGIGAGAALTGLLLPWVTWASRMLTTVVMSIVHGVGAEASEESMARTILGSLPWIVGVLSLILWVAALLPRVNEGMGWRMVWLGVFIPTLILMAPPAVAAPTWQIIYAIAGTVRQLVATLIT